MNPDSSENAEAPLAAHAKARARRWSGPAGSLVVLGLAIFILLLLEILLRCVGYGPPTHYFVRGTIGGEQWVFPDVRFNVPFYTGGVYVPPFPERFKEKKGEGTYRIFVFGSSAASGYPDPAFSFWRVLQTQLEARYPGIRFEILNTSAAAINSHVIAAIARDCAAYKPDLYIVYMGNNELIGPFGSGAGSLGRLLLAFQHALRRTSLGRAAFEINRWWRPPQSPRAEIVERRSDDPRLQFVREQFRANLRIICGAARDAGAHVVLCSVANNLRDTHPFRSRFRPGLSAEDRARWQTYYDESGARQQSNDFGKALEYYEAAAAIDGTFAMLHHRMAQCCEALGKIEDARRHYVAARDEDAYRARCDSALNGIVSEIADEEARNGIVFGDAAQAFLANSMTRAPGDDLFYDHVHMDFTGNCLLARTVLAATARVLPERVRSHEAPGANVLSDSACADALGYTPLDACNALATTSSLVAAEGDLGVLDRVEADAAQSRIKARAGALMPQITPSLLTKIRANYERRMNEPTFGFAERGNYINFLTKTQEAAAAEEQSHELARRYPFMSESP